MISMVRLQTAVQRGDRLGLVISYASADGNERAASAKKAEYGLQLDPVARTLFMVMSSELQLQVEQFCHQWGAPVIAI